MFRILFICFLFFIKPACLYAEKPIEITWSTLRGLNHYTGKANEEVSNLDGKLVRLDGFAVPLVGERFDQIEELLFVPDPMMCIHVPPPPPNQLLHIRMKKGTFIDSFIPFRVTGRLAVSKTKSSYGHAGYEMIGYEIEMLDDEGIERPEYSH